jgi:hypothetical protein
VSIDAIAEEVTASMGGEELGGMDIDINAILSGLKPES